MRILLALSLVVLATLSARAQAPPQPAVPMARFVGTWVGTQRWTIANPPPGSRQDQPVTLILEEADGKLRGTLTPFLGGEDGATIVEAAIVGSELRATAVAGNGRGRGGWKAPVRIAFVFTNEGLLLKGSAEVRMGDVPWMTFGYDLERKRSRY
jgi:hypothetical protein